MAYIETIGGIALPPFAYDSGQFNIATLVDSGRSTDGRFVGQVIGDDKFKIECSWQKLSQSDVQKILKLFDRKQGGSFTNKFKIFDPRTGQFEIMEMYVSDRSGRPFDPNSNWIPSSWMDFKFSLVEV